MAWANPSLAAAPAPMIQLVFRHLAAQGVAVNAQDFGGTRLVAIGALQDAFDEALLEFPDGLVKQDSALHHLGDKPFQLISHVNTLRGLAYFEGAGLLLQFVPYQDAVGFPVFGTRRG